MRKIDKMKQKIGIVVCGNSGIDYLNIDFPVKVIRSTLLLDGKEYEDYVDIKAEDFYKLVIANPNIDIRTSQTSTGRISEVYNELKETGVTDIIVITVSSKLSGTFQGAILAKELVDDINVYVVDSKSVSQGEVFLVEKAIELINKKVEAEVIYKKLNELRDNLKIYVLVDTLKYLVKNGRLSATSGFLGTMLKIKPLLVVNEEGSLVPFEKIRTTSKARERLFEIVTEEIKDKDVSVYIAYTSNKEEAIEFASRLKEQNNIKVEVVPLTPVVGAHAGPGTMGVIIINN
ncbi:DegV family protein [Haploplasma modicum]|uniref:DegV family protein n=1 Tax=Haploplasma modicum TaxID=2150 RepID=UPI00214B3434|nr:DegV family protein [Haploplasma modicum]MCR1808664.1 DegV family protein [Haploplasma modicum]